MTNVEPWQLNYDRYSSNKYDRDIVNSIPFHQELHQKIADFIKMNFDPKKEYHILDLGVGTGITAKLVQDLLPNAKIEGIDFSKQMLAGARKKLGTKNVKLILADYSTFSFKEKYDLVISVIGIHHQNNQGKKKLFRKIYSLLNPGGVFLFGDLVTHGDQHEAALSDAMHYHHLVSHATDKKTLKEWAHHHMYLNDLAPVEDQITWLEKLGFQVQKALLKWNTALLICKRK